MIRAFVRWFRRRFRRAKREPVMVATLDGRSRGAKREPVTVVTFDGDGFVSEVEWRE